MSIFKRGKNKINVGKIKPLKKSVQNKTDSTAAIDKTKSVFDLLGVDGNASGVSNPPKRINIKQDPTETSESNMANTLEDVSDSNSYTLKKVQTKKKLENTQTSTPSKTSTVAETAKTDNSASLNQSLDDITESVSNIDVSDLEVEMKAAINEISEMELEDEALSIDDLPAQMGDNYSEDSIGEDVFDLESLDLELNDDEFHDELENVASLNDDEIDVSHDTSGLEDEYLDEDIIDEPLSFEDTDEEEEITRPSIVQLRHDISKISTDFENGDALYKRAQMRIKNLNGFAEKAELSFSLVSRLEPENRRLKARNLTITRDLETNKINLSRVETELSAQNQRIAELSEDLEATQSLLSSTLATLSDTEKELSKIKQEHDIQLLRGDREKNSYEIENRENLRLRSKISSLNDEIDFLSSEKISLTNQMESMKIDMEDLQKSKEASEKTAYDVTLELEKARDHNAEITRQITTIQEDVKSFKTQYEYNVLTRDDRIFALEAELQGLAKQLSLKDEILNNTSADAQNLRKTRSDGELERERLERLIENQSQQLKLAEAQLLQSRANIQEMDKRYKDAATALARVNDRRNDQVPSLSPDIRPAEISSEMAEIEEFLTQKS